MAERVEVPEYPDLVHIEAAADEVGVCVRSLLRLIKKARKKYGAAARVVKKPGRTADGWTRQRTYVPRWLVNECKAGRPKAPSPPDRDSSQPGKLRVDEVAEILGLTRSGVYALVRTGKLKSETRSVV